MNAEHSPIPLSAAAVAALQMGNKIEALRIIRRESGADLKDALGAVNAYVARDPALQEILRSKSAGGRIIGWIVLILSVAAIVGYVLIDRTH